MPSSTMRYLVSLLNATLLSYNWHCSVSGFWRVATFTVPRYQHNATISVGRRVLHIIELVGRRRWHLRVVKFLNCIVSVSTLLPRDAFDAVLSVRHTRELYDKG